MGIVVGCLPLLDGGFDNCPIFIYSNPRFILSAPNDLSSHTTPVLLLGYYTTVEFINTLKHLIRNSPRLIGAKWKAMVNVATTVPLEHVSVFHFIKPACACLAYCAKCLSHVVKRTHVYM